MNNKSTIKLVLIGCLVLFVAFVFLSITNIPGIIYEGSLRQHFPSKSDQIFINACKNLKGKKFNFENIKSVGGLCWIQGSVYKPERKPEDGVSLVTCTEKHINEYLEFQKHCGDYVTKEVLANMNSYSCDDSNNNCVLSNPESKKFSDCLENFHKSSELWIGYDNNFRLRQNIDDSAWHCSITNTNSMESEYFYEAF